jgi:di/tricarboxylate transporter
LTLHQFEAFAILAVMLGLFASDRLRYDLVGGLALIAAALTGIVPNDKVFEGFSNPVIIIIASVLVVSRAITNSGVVERAIQHILRHAQPTSLQVGILTTCVAGLSAFMKNVGTLGIFMPIAIQTAERSKRLPSLYLMPLAFGSLVGGTMTLIGTGPNLLISTVRQEVEGKPFRLFDFFAVGGPLTVVAILFLSFAWRLIPKNRRGPTASEQQFSIEIYAGEVNIPEDSPLVGKTVGDLEELGEHAVTVTSIIRGGDRRYIANSQWPLVAGDVVVLQGDMASLKPLLAAGELVSHVTGEAGRSLVMDDAVENVEAIVKADSPIIGQSQESLQMRRRFEASILAINRGGQQFRSRLPQTILEAGDVLMVQGRREIMSGTLAHLGCLPLSERHLIHGRKRAGLLPIGILVVAMVAVAFRLVSAEVAFFAAAVLVVLSGLISPKEAYESIDWQIVVMLGCLIPVGEALKLTGASGLIANGLTQVAMHLPDSLALSLIIVASMLVTPFLHHAAAVLVMGPVAATLAHNLGYQPDPFLMAVALGASSDFLSPIGHQNNALVMGPGGYRFGDYWRLGLPLSIIVAVLGTVLIRMAWPLR